MLNWTSTLEDPCGLLLEGSSSGGCAVEGVFLFVGVESVFEASASVKESPDASGDLPCDGECHGSHPCRASIQDGVRPV